MQPRMRTRSGFDDFRDARSITLLLDPMMSKNVTKQMPTIAKEWKALTTEERASYNEIALARGPVPVKGRARKRRREEKKDPLKPKGPLSSYIFFSMKRLPVLQEEHSISVTDGIKLVAKEWHTVGLDKSEYIQLALEDSARYQREKTLYTALVR
jgi:hypothetical protein